MTAGAAVSLSTGMTTTVETTQAAASDITVVSIQTSRLRPDRRRWTRSTSDVIIAT